MSSPVLLLIFNRPDTTALVMEAIRAARPPRLYVAADGPRDRPGEAERCEEARRIATAVDWPCEVRTLFCDRNLGCGEAPQRGITWFFEHEEEGIILEDDCLPHLSFFGYCDQLLSRYRHSPRVMSICGSSFVRRGRSPYDYSFTYFPSGWGWASWRRAWKGYDFRIQNWRERGRLLEEFFPNSPEVSEFWRKRFEQVHEGEVDTWDYQWTWHVISNNGFCVTPHRNLVANIGFGAEATHTLRRSYVAHRPIEGFQGALRHPSRIVRDLALERDLALSRWRIRRTRQPLRTFDAIRFYYLLFSSYDFSYALTQPVRDLLHRAFYKAKILALGIKRKFTARELDRADCEVIVISPGGVATTTMLRYLRKFVHVNDVDDRDGLKHCPKPRVRDLSNRGLKILFIYGDPNKIYNSIRRRGWVDIQGAKLGGLITAFAVPYLQKWAFRRLVEKQIGRWLRFERGPGRNIVRCLSYDEIWDRSREIAEFANISDGRFVADFPGKQERSGDRSPQGDDEAHGLATVAPL